MFGKLIGINNKSARIRILRGKHQGNPGSRSRRVKVGGSVKFHNANKLPGIHRLINDAKDDIASLVIETSRLYLAQIEALSAQVSSLEAVLKKEAAQSDASSRMITMPGLGSITAMAIEAFAPTLTVFQKRRDFAA